MQSIPRANENQNRYTRRQEQRRKIDCVLRSENQLLPRRSPSMDEVEHLMKSIMENRVSEFGLNKLCNLRLDERHCSDQYAGSMTFLTRAIHKRRDKIAMALIRAGAAPLDSINECSHEQTIRLAVLQYPSSYIVWLLTFAQTRVRTSAICSTCESTNVEAIEMESCQHTICQQCFWKNLHSVDVLHSLAEKQDYSSLLSPQVKCIACGQCSSSTSISKPTDRMSLFSTAPMCCKASSFDMWNRLPAGFAHQSDEQQAPRPAKESSQGAMHLAELAQCHLGSTRTQRNEELIKACSKADLRRIAALVEAGVHVDYQDEYGMTALMLSAWLGHLQAVKLLNAAGADVSLSDALGNTALSIATAVGRADIVTLLLQLQTAACDNSTVDRSPAVSGAITLPKERRISSALPDGITSVYSQSVVFAAGESEQSTQVSPIATVLIPKLPAGDHFTSPTVTAVTAVTNVTATADVAESGAASDVVSAEYWRQHGVKGAEKGAFCLDRCFSESFLQRLLAIFRSLPVAPSEKTHCAARSYFCDVRGEITGCIEATIASALGGDSSGSQYEEARRGPANCALALCGANVKVFPQMRFMHYQHAGSALAPHVDLHRKDVRRYASNAGHNAPTVLHKETPADTSTHTMILYLTDCQVGGGETVLLRLLNRRQSSASEPTEGKTNDTGCENEQHLAAVSPRYGRLLLFPHNCPHEGRPILADDPKILLRGEVYLGEYS